MLAQIPLILCLLLCYSVCYHDMMSITIAQLPVVDLLHQLQMDRLLEFFFIGMIKRFFLHIDWMVMLDKGWKRSWKQEYRLHIKVAGVRWQANVGKQMWSVARNRDLPCADISLSGFTL